MKTMNEAQSPSALLAPEYEWGVKYRSVWGGGLETVWGYDADPRTTGVIDEEGDIEINSYYHPVVAVGKRVKSPEVWENV
jgi:hypothetical protein